MNKRTNTAALSAVTVATVMASIALANNVTLPNTFQPNTPAKAAEVNANFSAVKTASDDNYALILTQQTNLATTNGNVTSLQSAVSTLNSSQATYWRKGGNAGTTAGTDYLGTSDNQALEVKVNGARVARFEPPNTLSSGSPSVILGTSSNSITAGVQGAFVAGGYPGAGNTVTSSQGAVVAGAGNTAGSLGFVGAGTNNTSGQDAFVGAGYGNIASGFSSTVTAGYGNTASGNMATVAGGWFNTAAGSTSFAAGFRANAALDGCFVWGDSFSRATPFSCTVKDQWMVMASGGVVFQTSNSGTAGVSLGAGGGSWNSLSDRNAKESLAPVSPSEVLEKVVSMPVSSWSYKTEKGVTHLGPMAQDFYQAFKLGTDDRHIGTVDAEGVALAAIQGLNAKTVALQHENAQLRAELSDLRQRLDALARGAR
jgi:Chaperone of endosialidase